MAPSDEVSAALDRIVQEHRRGPEDPGTADLIRRLRRARSRGYLTVAEFLAAGRWKSARVSGLMARNRYARVRRATGAALTARSERRRIEPLLGLEGVSIPMASAILTLVDPRRYGVLDIRVWQLLYRAGAVSKTPRGQGFTFEHWNQFLAIVRGLAKKHRLTTREVERALFEAHRRGQVGRLYDPPAAIELRA